MQTTNLRGFGAMLARLAETDDAAPTARGPAAARELQLLDVGHDTAARQAPFETSTLAGSKIATTLADRARLPPPPQPGRHIGRAAQRILGADTSIASPTSEDVLAEARMRVALSAIAEVVAYVQVEVSRGRGR